MLGAKAKGPHCLDGLVPHGQQRVDAGAAGESTDLRVHGRGIRTQLAHIAHDENFSSGGLRQHRNGGGHGIRIGVVGIVDDHGAVQPRLALQAALGSRVGRESAGDGIRRHVERHGDGAGRRGVVDVVFARHAQRRPDVAARRGEADFAARCRFAVIGAHCAVMDAKANLLSARRLLRPVVGEGIVGVDERHAIGLEAGEDFALGPGNVRNTSQLAHMRAMGVVDERRVGPGYAAQIVDFPEMVHAHFDHRKMVPLAQLQQCQRHADVVVEIALGGQDRGIVVARGAQNGRRHFLHRGLAVGAGECHQPPPETIPPPARELAQGQPRVRHPNHRDAGIFRQHFVQQRAGRSGPGRRRDKVMAVEFFAGQRHEQVIRRHGAAIGGHAADHARRGGRRQFAVDRLGSFLKRHESLVHGAAFMASARVATSRSLKAWRTPCTSW